MLLFHICNMVHTSPRNNHNAAVGPPLCVLCCKRIFSKHLHDRKGVRRNGAPSKSLTFLVDHKMNDNPHHPLLTSTPIYQSTVGTLHTNTTSLSPFIFSLTMSNDILEQFFWGRTPQKVECSSHDMLDPQINLILHEYFQNFDSSRNKNPSWPHSVDSTLFDVSVIAGTFSGASSLSSSISMTPQRALMVFASLLTPH